MVGHDLVHRHAGNAVHAGHVALMHQQVGKAGWRARKAGSGCRKEGKGWVRVVKIGGRGSGREEGGIGTTRGRTRRGKVSTIYIQSWVLFFPFCSSVLEPDLDLGFGKVKG